MGGVLILLTTILLSTYLHAFERLCPHRFPCPCLELISTGGKILHLKCNDMNLTTVPDLSQLLNPALPIYKLDLSRNQIVNLEDYAFSGLHFVTYFTSHTPELLLDNNPIRHISSHAFFGIQVDSLRLQMMDTQMAYIPIQQLEIITNLTHLYISGPKITEVPDGIFANLPLTVLDLSGIKLKTLSPGIFGGLENNVETLFLRNMQLSSFPVESLKVLKRLKSLDLGVNNIEELAPYLFKGFETKHNFFIMGLNRNNIKNISSLTFHKNGTSIQIMTLDLEHNKIESVDFLSDPCSTIFRPRHSTIRLDHNPIQCDCDLFSVANTGSYTIRGECDGPGKYSGKRFDVWYAIREQGPRYQTVFGNMATEDCMVDQELTWDLSCREYHSPEVNSDSRLSHHTSIHIFILIISYHLS